MIYLALFACYGFAASAAPPAQIRVVDERLRPFAADGPLAGTNLNDGVQQRRSRFVSLVKMGVFERFDDAKQEAVFKHHDPGGMVHEPGPLEDEAIASAARETLAVRYARLHLRPHLTCTGGKVSIGKLPDDAAEAAAVVDAVLSLDGVHNVTVTLPASLRQP